MPVPRAACRVAVCRRRRSWPRGGLDVNAAVVDTGSGPVLRAGFAFPTGVLDAAEVGELARRWSAALAGLARHARRRMRVG